MPSQYDQKNKTRNFYFEDKKHVWSSVNNMMKTDSAVSVTPVDVSDGIKYFQTVRDAKCLCPNRPRRKDLVSRLWIVHVDCFYETRRFPKKIVSTYTQLDGYQKIVTVSRGVKK